MAVRSCYLPLDQVVDTSGVGEDIAAVLGSFAGSVLAVGAAHEQALVAGVYPQLAFEGKVPRLLSEVGRLSGIAAPAISLVSGAWEPIGLGAIEDLVQEAFGPVDLDRSPVRLEPAAEQVTGCPACAGQRLGFPAELGDALPAMCAPHVDRAQAITEERLQRAWESNRDGMDAITGTSGLLTEPTFGLSLALLRDLDDIARRDPTERLSSSELAADAKLALDLAQRLTGEPEQFEALMASDHVPPDWMIELPAALASGGLIDEAVAVGDAFAALDAASADLYAADVALILAQAGRAPEALARVQASGARAGRDVWAHIRAAAVHAELGDPEQAEASLQSALVLARSSGDADDIATVWQRLGELLAEQPGREHEAEAAMGESERWSDAADGGPRFVIKVGRNDPCPCGSGRKHKRCCGA